MSIQAYNTGDLNLATFLCAYGYPVINTQSRSGRAIFSFEDSERLQSDVLKYLNDSPVQLKPRTFLNTFRDMKGLIRSAA
jgi:hypothetical protein